MRRDGPQRLRSNDFARAIELLARVLASVPDDASTQLNRGIALQSAGRRAEAVEVMTALQKSLPHDPAGIPAHGVRHDTRVRTVSRAQVRQPVDARGLSRSRAYEQQLQPPIAALAQAGASDSAHAATPNQNGESG